MTKLKDETVTASDELKDELAAQILRLATDPTEAQRQTDARVDNLAASMAQIVTALKALDVSVNEIKDRTVNPRGALKSETAAQIASTKESERLGKEREHFETALKQSRIQALQLAQLFPGIERQTVALGTIDPDTAQPNHVDSLYVCAIARHVRAGRIFEFGTYLGRTTHHLAIGRLAREVFTLDLAPEDQPAHDLKIGRAVRAVRERGLQGYFFQGKPSEKRITQLHGDSRTFDFSPYLGSMDFIFIDGGHSRELVETDTTHAFEMLMPGGVVVWHDYAPKTPDVVDFAREFSQTKPLFWILDTALLLYVDGVDATAFDAPQPVYARDILKPS